MKKLRRVSPEDFDVEALMAAAREGRLYVDEKQCVVSREVVKGKVRAYVARISVFATQKFSSSVDELWETVLDNDEFLEFLMPGPKAKKCRTFNKYGVMRIVGVLREKGVYEQHSDRKYIALLEQTDKDCSYRSYLGAGFEQRALLVKISQIVNTNKY